MKCLSSSRRRSKECPGGGKKHGDEYLKICTSLRLRRGDHHHLSKLANLIYQMQFTGYMLKNAEYRMSLTRTLKGMPKFFEQSMIQKGKFSASPLSWVLRTMP